MGHKLGVTEPVRDDMAGVGLGKLRFSAGPHVLEYPGPCREPRPADDPLKLSPQIAVRAAVSFAPSALGTCARAYTKILDPL